MSWSSLAHALGLYYHNKTPYSYMTSAGHLNFVPLGAQWPLKQLHIDFVLVTR